MNRKRNHLGASLAFAIAILGFGVSAQAQKAPRRIVFARGATIARASGYLRGVRDEAWLVIRASAGQHMRVEIRGRQISHSSSAEKCDGLVAISRRSLTH